MLQQLRQKWQLQVKDDQACRTSAAQFPASATLMPWVPGTGRHSPSSQTQSVDAGQQYLNWLYFTSWCKPSWCRW